MSGLTRALWYRGPKFASRLWHSILSATSLLVREGSIVYVTLNTTYAFNRSAIYLPDGLPVFINAYGFPLLCYCVLVLLIDLLKQLLFAAGKDLALSFSDILSMIRHLRFWDGIYLVTVHNP